MQERIDIIWSYATWLGDMVAKAVLWTTFVACLPLIPFMLWQAVLG